MIIPVKSHFWSILGVPSGLFIVIMPFLAKIKSHFLVFYVQKDPEKHVLHFPAPWSVP